MQLRIGPNTSEELTIDEGEPAPALVAADFARTHTGISDFEAQVTFDTQLEDRVLDEVFLEDNGELLFRGTILSVESTAGTDSIETRISGEGVGRELTNTETTFSVSDTFAHEAIRDFLNTETTFDASVTDPSPTSVADNAVAQSAATTAEFADITPAISDTTPLNIQNGGVKLQQAGFFTEAEAATRSFVASTTTDTAASGGESVTLFDATNPHFVARDFTLEYDLPSSRQLWAIRVRVSNTSEVPAIRVLIDGTTALTTPQDWTSNSGFFWFVQQDGIGSTLAAGTHTFRVEIDQETTNTESIDIDAIWLGDDEYQWTFDNSVDANGFLSGPQLFPDAERLRFAVAETPFNVTAGEAEVQTADPDGAQLLQLRIASGTFRPTDGTQTNTTLVTTDFGADKGSDVQSRVEFARFGSRTTASPTTGFRGQKLESLTLRIDGNDLAVLNRTFRGSLFEILQELHEVATMRFVVSHDRTEKRIESFAPGDETRALPEVAVKSQTRRKDLSDYANAVTVRSAEVGGSRFSATVESADEIQAVGTRELTTVIDPRLTTQSGVDNRARKLLARKIRERTDKGELEIAPTPVTPGFSYDNPFGSTDETVPLEETRFEVRRGRVSGRLVFDFKTDDLSAQLGGLEQQTRALDSSL